MDEPTDPKVQALVETATLNPAPERILDPRFRAGEFFDPRDAMQVKYEMLRCVEHDKDSITEAAERFGYSRPTFYKARRAFEQEGLSGLVPKRPGPRRPHKLTPEVVAYLEQRRAPGEPIRAAELKAEVEEHFGICVHRRSIERLLSPGKKNESG